tara:strand:- start:707 stop:2407 length:1701 start_codon:yes stop_codon:yes gene_type:complete
MLIVALHNDEDSGVCLMKDGQILEAVNEERFNRTKLYKGLPQLSLDYVLQKHDLDVGQVDHFVYGWHGRQNDFGRYARKLSRRVAKAVTHNPASVDIIDERVGVEFERDAETRGEFEDWMKELGVPSQRLMFVDHHSSHSWAAFSCSPFDSAFVFTFDGRGDLKSGTVSIASRDAGIQEQDYLLSFDSLGFLYGQITGYLGYQPHRHEGKVTGLAAYGDPDKTLPLFRSMIDWEDGSIVAKLGPYRPFYTKMDPDLARQFDEFSREDIAAGVQKHCEDLLTRFVSYWIERSDRPEVRNVCLAGGVFANVRINQCIAELPGVDEVFVFPHMGDGGLTVGSACLANHVLTGASKVEFDSVYLGPNFDDTQIEDCLESYGARIKFQHLNDKVERTVEDLLEEKVVGYFDGRMEFGPRALGARSILYHARDRSVNDWLNQRLRRTEFMPFAPVTPVEYAPDCYIGWQESDACTPFMTKTFDCTEAFSRGHQAVVHIDGTARPQIVTQDRNGDYYQVVKSFCDRNGDRALINTSFNAHEEPIVCSPHDAVDSLLDDTVDVLVIGSYRVARA